MLISFEGADGSGKSSQAKRLYEHLKGQGIPVILTREPGGSPGAEEIRGLLLSGDEDKWSPETELLLFTAARRDHLEKTILPALDAGKIVITDRYVDSTRVYQGIVRSDLADRVDDLHALMIAKDPDLTFVIDCDPVIGLQRSLAKNQGLDIPEDRFEKFGLEFQKNLTFGFQKVIENYPERAVGIDGNGTPDEVFHRIVDAFQKKMEMLNLDNPAPGC